MSCNTDQNVVSRHVATLTNRPRTLIRARCRRTSAAANTQARRARLPVRREEARLRIHRDRCLPVRWPAKRMWAACTSAITSTRSRPCSARRRSRSRASIFAGVTGNPKAFRSTAVASEDLATAAYKEQAPLIQYRQTTNHRGRCAAASPRCRSEGRPSRPAPKVRRHGPSSRSATTMFVMPSGVRAGTRPTGALSNFGARRATVPRSTGAQHVTSAASVNGTGRPVGKADGSAVSGSPPYVDVSPTKGRTVRRRRRQRMRRHQRRRDGADHESTHQQHRPPETQSASRYG
jgi:hypothetical protein